MISQPLLFVLPLILLLLRPFGPLSQLGPLLPVPRHLEISLFQINHLFAHFTDFHAAGN